MPFDLLKFISRKMSFCLVRHIKRQIAMKKMIDSLANKGAPVPAVELDVSAHAGVFGNGAKKGSGKELPFFDFGMVEKVTNNFNCQNKLGEGGFGPVYKGRLPDGQEIAVKRLSKMSRQGLTEFENEVVLISGVQHRNLVRLLGCCIEGEEKLLLYEFMPNKSLDAFLFDAKKKETLDWPRRYNIVEGIARGLLYLHRDSRLRIIHRDLKASNILLDEHFNAKISDFGLARMFSGDQIKATTLRVAGTLGYMSPEYAMEGRFSEKSDVFSFGVLLLEIVSGKRNNNLFDDDQYMNLLGYAWTLWSDNRAYELIYPSMNSSLHKPEVLKCINIGLLCVQEYPIDRPTISSVVTMLNSDTCLPTPKKAAFFEQRSRHGFISYTEEAEACSPNHLTISDLGCR